MAERAMNNFTPGPARALGPEALAEAVRRARAGGDEAAGFRALEAQLAPRLLRYFRAHAFAPPDAEDLVQAVLLRVWRGLPQLQQAERFLVWVFVIARNVARTARSRQRRERHWIAGGSELAEDVPDPRAAASLRDHAEAERWEAMRAIIDELPPQQRQCLLLQLREELSYEEISETLRLSLHTVRNHLAAARKTLRQRLQRDLAERA
jgi:RNA polymerase sigma-70 factor (ECF subfamily)